MASERRAHDAYFTPTPLAAAICERLCTLIPAPSSILEPSAGEGVFVACAKNRWPDAMVVGFDAQPAHASITRRDFFDLGLRNVELVLGNPPWSLADEFVAKALEVVKPGGHVAFLLRTSFWHGQGRVDALHGKTPPKWWLPLRERWSYSGDGKTDSVDSSVFIWQRGHDAGTTVLPHLSAREGHTRRRAQSVDVPANTQGDAA